jgi:hypothetical protein
VFPGQRKIEEKILEAVAIRKERRRVYIIFAVIYFSALFKV